MPPPAEMDGRVAEKVFGHRVSQDNSRILSPKDVGRYWKKLPAYSTDHAAMMMVIEKMRERKYNWLIANSAGLWSVNVIDNGRPISHGYDASLPLAVCRAALAALEAVK